MANITKPGYKASYNSIYLIKVFSIIYFWMFKSLDEGGHESALTKSTIKDIRSGFISKTKLPEEDFEVVVPKKSPLTSIKTRTGDDKKVEVILLDGKPVFIVMD